jgi:hypothetical protein
MRRLVTFAVAAVAALALASCSPETPNSRYECACVATSLATDNTRNYTLCESDGTAVKDDATTQCEKDLGGSDAGCECTCERNGSCELQ